MKVRLFLSKIPGAVASVWDRLPTEVRVAFYYTGAWVLNELAEALMNFESIDWNTFLRVLVANVGLVFIGKLKERSAAIRSLLSK